MVTWAKLTHVFAILAAMLAAAAGVGGVWFLNIDRTPVPATPRVATSPRQAQID